ncbi:MAG TPA: hypothetical protein VFZ83_01880 [Acidimicrobiia bacterium]|nr:hypothetical protein [Acidimicrobiia bacterium]
MRDPRSFVDLDRYPIVDPGEARTRVVEAARASLRERGVAIFPGFIRPDVVAEIAAEVVALEGRTHLEDVWGTPYLELPDESFPDAHPRHTAVHSRTGVLAYDLVPADSPARALYEWDGLLDLLADVLERRPLYRMADPLGALNLTIMRDGHVQGWHYDSTDFVVSLSVASSERGGEFECARDIRDDQNEHYDEVARVLAGTADDLVEVYPMTPGTMMVFAGRRSLHRVAPVRGNAPRIVALFGYDTTPGANSSDLLKLVRYGRTEPLGADA